MTTTVHQLGINKLETYLFSVLFIAGNIVLPQLCHLIPNGGVMLLPLYFFTLVAAYKFGLNVGILTAVGSPLMNHLLFGMPATGMLALIMTKSILLAVIAAMVAKHVGKVTLYAVAIVVAMSVLAGVMAEWALNESLLSALNSVKIAIPGILIQIFGCYMLLIIWRK